MKKHAYYISFFLLGMMAIVTAYFFYWTLYPFKVVEINNNPVPVAEKVVRQGGPITYTVNFCRFTDVPAVSTRVYVDGIEFYTPAIISQFPVGCYLKSFTATVPDSLPPGEYHLEIRNAYQINKLREVPITFETQKFTVIK